MKYMPTYKKKMLKKIFHYPVLIKHENSKFYSI